MKIKQKNVYETEFIEIVNSLFDKTMIDKSLIVNDKIDIQTMLENLGYTVKYRKQNNLDMNGWVDLNKRTIVIYNHTPKPKQRLLFALAISYQIKHKIDKLPDIAPLLLPENGVIDDTDFAHYFSQQLLVPEKLLAYHYGVKDLNELTEQQLDDNLEHVAQQLEVPYHMIDDQLYDLGYFEDDEDENDD